MTHPVIIRRQAQRQELLSLAAAFAGRLDDLGVHTVVVFGSVARGDFNAWSDVDVLVVADALPRRWLDRLARLVDRASPGISALAWSPAEMAREVARGNPIAVEVMTLGVVVRGTLPQPRDGSGSWSAGADTDRDLG
ncbi:MAG: nucleotidyltransferase domain-containing protein [Actinomycetota bacterium]|nr:nucleotidyltransferase domain-containing protein [Actinomycetota bacterium]